MSIIKTDPLATAMPLSGAPWPKRYTLLALCFLAAFVCYIDRVNISVAVIAMQERFGWSETVKGLVLSSFFIGYMLFQIPSGYLANRFGGKWVLGIAVAWWSIFTIITPFAALSLPLLIAARIGMGLGEAAMFPGAYNLFGRWIPPVERSRAVALLLSGV
ncbi:MAG TPA: MFS transporter, partial [Spongiibacteraceae bacterium]|nr:MFS transporter [Spongiibacteraceae bacterium]